MHAALFAEKFNHQVHRILRVLLHDPVARMRDNSHLNTGRNKPDVVRHARAEGFLSADCEHRHAELATLGKQRLVIDRILAEGAELFERVVDGMRPRVQAGSAGASACRFSSGPPTARSKSGRDRCVRVPSPGAYHRARENWSAITPGCE